MSIRGAQDYWVAGAEVYFKRKGATDDSMINLGTIKSIAPNFEVEKITLDDPAGGVKTRVLELVSKFTESYSFTCANFSPDNLALIFNATSAQTFSQSATFPASVAHTTKAGRIHKVKNAAGDFMYGLSALVVTRPSYAITGVTTGSKLFKIAGDHVAEFNVPGAKVRVSGNAGAAASNLSYTVVSGTLNSGSTDIVVSETVDAGTTVSGRIAKEYTLTTDYEVVDLTRGLFRTVSGGGIADATTVEVAYVTAAVASGLRLIAPQTGPGTIEGTMILVLGREGNLAQSIRECEVALSTNSLNLTADDASDFTLSATVLADRTDVVTPAGRLLQVLGDLPAVS